jgi:hypothetical protein
MKAGHAGRFLTHFGRLNPSRASKTGHPGPSNFVELSAITAAISQQASPPQAKQVLLRQVVVERSMECDLSARTALIHRQKQKRLS